MYSSIAKSMLVALFLALVPFAIAPSSLLGQAGQEELEGLWQTEKGDEVVRYTRQGNGYVAHYVTVPSYLQPAFKVGQQVWRNTSRTGPNTFAGEGLWHVGGQYEWRKHTLTIKGNRLLIEPTNIPPRTLIRIGAPGGAHGGGQAGALDGLWCGTDGSELRFNGANGTIAKASGPLSAARFTVGEQTLRGITKTGPNTYKGEVKRRWNDGRPPDWGPITLTIQGDKMTTDPVTLSGAFARCSGSAAGCPPNIIGSWLGPISGVITYQMTGDTVTGSIANLDGKYGPTTVTGKLVGTGLSGRWKSATASGGITVQGPDAKCVTSMTYTVDDGSAPGGTKPGGTESVGFGGGGPGGGLAGGGPHGKPWDNPQGQGCFEEWIALATKLLNAHDGDKNYNLRKPWSFNKYGLLEGTGLKSAFAPDNFPQYNNNKHWWMWDYWVTDAFGRWGTQALNDARVPPLRDYVNRCYAAQGGGGGPGTGEPPLGDGMIVLAPDLVVPRGSRVLVPIQVINARDLKNMRLELQYMPEIVSARTDAEKGSAITEYWASNLRRPGSFLVDFASEAIPFNGRGTVVGLVFDATGPGRSRTPLTLTAETATDSTNAQIARTMVNGSITIYDPADLTDPNNPNNPNPPGGPGGKMQPTCSGTGVQTVADVICVLRMSVELIPAGMQMDINGDGKVNSDDARRILQNLRGRLQ